MQEREKTSYRFRFLKQIQADENDEEPVESELLAEVVEDLNKEPDSEQSATKTQI